MRAQFSSYSQMRTLILKIEEEKSPLTVLNDFLEFEKKDLEVTKTLCKFVLQLTN
jgi:hypothetical protein